MTQSKKVNPVNDSNTTRIAVLETNVSYIGETLDRIEKRFDKIDKHLDGIAKEMIDVRKESWSQFRWSLGIMITLFLANTSAIIAIITKMVH